MKYFTFLAFLFFLSCSKEEEAIKPTFSSITESVYASGKVEAKQQYQVFPTINGIVEKIYKSEADDIAKGELILSIKNETQSLNKANAKLSQEYADLKLNQSKLEDAKSKVNFAKSNLENDSLLYIKQKNLWEKSVGSKLELDRAELKYKNSKMNLVSAMDMLDQVKRQLKLNSKQSANNYEIANLIFDDYNIRSMIDGEVYDIFVEVGELVTPQKKLAVIGEKGQFVLKMDVDERDIKDIRVGQEVIIELNSHIDSTYKAKVTKIYPLMNEQTKTFLVEAEFISKPASIYPNVSFEANIILSKKEKAMLIPLEYLQGESVKLKDGKFAKVKLGLKNFEKVEILSGIDENTEIVKP